MRVEDTALAELGWPQVLSALTERCHTTRGQEAARAVELDRPAAESQERSAEIAEARRLRAEGEPMPWGGIHDLRSALARAEKGGALEGEDLRQVAETLRGGAVLRRFLLARFEGAPRLAARAEPIAELPDVSGPIDDSFEPGGRLCDHASPALGPLRRRAADLHGELGRTVRGLLEDATIAPLLQDRFYTQRDDRYVLPIKAAARGRVRGIMHGSSQSGATVFLEPEVLVDLNNALKLAELDIADEERRILAALTAGVVEELPRIGGNGDILVTLDLVDAAARLADDLDAAPLSVFERGPIALRSARHPLLVLAGRPCVPVDLLVGEGGTLVISGPNAGGKTVALKTLGLLALMAQAGLHLPVDPSSELPLFDELACDIGDEQSLERNLSTFSAHVLHLRAFLERAAPGLLVLLDEIAVGTDPSQGAALAQAVLEALAERGATVVVTTHYDRLKVLAAGDPRFRNASVGFDLERLEPTFVLHHGVPGSSGALQVARRLELPPAVVDRAAALLGEREVGIEELLVSLADERRRLESERARLAEARREAERAQAAAEAQAETLKRRLRELHLQSHDEAIEALKAARAELERLRAGRRRVKDPEAAVDAAARSIRAHAPERAADGAPVREEELAPGMRVVVAAWGGEGVVVAPPERGRVLVQAGALKTTVAVEALRRPVGPAPRPSRAAPRPVAAGEQAEAAPVALRTPESTLDLRGERVDDALALLDKFLDQALTRGADAVFVLHGHGTGALRQAVRQELGRHPAVARFGPAAPEQGGDAVTAVELR